MITIFLYLLCVVVRAIYSFDNKRPISQSGAVSILTRDSYSMSPLYSSKYNADTTEQRALQNLKQMFEYQHSLFLRDIWWPRF